MGQNQQENSIHSQICLANLASSEEPLYEDLSNFQKSLVVWEKSEPPRGYSDTPPLISARQLQLTRAKLQGSFKMPLVALPELPTLQYKDKLKMLKYEMTRRRPRGQIIMEEAVFTESMQTLRRYPRTPK